MSSRTDPWRFVKPKHGEIAFVEAIDKIRHLLTDHDREILSHHKVEGVDTQGRIILRVSSELSRSQAGRSKVIKLISHALADNDWATGISLKYSEPPTLPSTPFKHLYLPPAFVSMTLPHRKQSSNEYFRSNGKLSLSILSRNDIGLPYGSIARLILLYLTTHRITSKNRRFTLSNSWRNFIDTIGISRNGTTLNAVKDQLKRLCSSSFSVLSIDSAKDESFKGLFITDKWSRSSEGIRISLSEKFFILSGKSVVPLETKVIHQLHRSSFELDLYCWLTHRTLNVKHPTLIEWKKLELQFGSNYNRLRDFRTRFCTTLDTVLHHKPVSPILEVLPEGLALKPANASQIDYIERLQRFAKKRTL